MYTVMERRMFLNKITHNDVPGGIKWGVCVWGGGGGGFTVVVTIFYSQQHQQLSQNGR